MCSPKRQHLFDVTIAYMKLILASEGFSTQEIVDECVRLCGKSADQISFAVINEGYAVEGGDKRWVLKNLNDIAGNFGGEIDFVNLLALELDEIRERIMAKDVIFVVGGDTGYLMSVFNKSGFADMLPEILKTKVYVGSSAGAIILGKRLDDSLYKILNSDEKDWGISKYMEIVDFAVIPHLGSVEFPGRDEKFEQVKKQHNGIIYGLKDDAAIVVDGYGAMLIGAITY